MQQDTAVKVVPVTHYRTAKSTVWTSFTEKRDRRMRRQGQDEDSDRGLFTGQKGPRRNYEKMIVSLRAARIVSSPTPGRATEKRRQMNLLDAPCAERVIPARPRTRHGRPSVFSARHDRNRDGRRATIESAKLLLKNPSQIGTRNSGLRHVSPSRSRDYGSNVRLFSKRSGYRRRSTAAKPK
jgi:hypothetical protein